MIMKIQLRWKQISFIVYALKSLKIKCELIQCPSSDLIFFGSYASCDYYS